jgi:hypothetical protein
MNASIVRTWHTQEEIERSEAAGDKFASVTWQQIFGRDSDARLSLLVNREDPLRYAALKREYEFAERIPSPEQRLAVLTRLDH